MRLENPQEYLALTKNSVKDYLELEGSSKAGAKEQAQDWKAAIIEIAKRRGEKKNGRTD